MEQYNLHVPIKNVCFAYVQEIDVFSFVPPEMAGGSGGD